MGGGGKRKNVNNLCVKVSAITWAGGGGGGGENPGESLTDRTPSTLATTRIPVAAVLRIHDILVCIRIRGSMPLTNGSGSCYFRH